MIWVIITFMVCATVLVLAFKNNMQQPVKEKDEENVVLVKRVKPSFRNPSKTMTSSFDEYKTSKGLYAPVKPGKGSMANDIDLRQKRQ